MKRLLLLATLGALIVPGLALAQRDNDRRPGVDRPGGPSTLPTRPPGPGTRPPGPGTRPPGPGTRPPVVRPPVVRPPVIRPPVVRPPVGRPPQFSWRGRYFNRYRGPAFRYPSGYAYRRWSVGALLPALLFGTNYYFNDWGPLGVGAPPPGRRWVRYGPDLLLVNSRTRRVEDVIYGVFD